LKVGADHESVAVVLPATAATLLGDPGTVAGVTLDDALDDAP
jgi:hypothetical protein